MLPGQVWLIRKQTANPWNQSSLRMALFDGYHQRVNDGSCEPVVKLTLKGQDRTMETFDGGKPVFWWLSSES